MNYSELLTELADRGFEDMDPERRGRYLNQAYQRICDRQAWPFLQAEKSGTPGTNGLWIEDLGAVRSVVDAVTENVIAYEDVRAILERDPALSATGVAVTWYLRSSDHIATYPNQAGPILVRYLRVPVMLDDGDDEPVIPERFQELIVDDAAARAHKSLGEYEPMGVCRTEFETGMREMEAVLLVPNLDYPEQIAPSRSTDW